MVSLNCAKVKQKEEDLGNQHINVWIYAFLLGSHCNSCTQGHVCLWRWGSDCNVVLTQTHIHHSQLAMQSHPLSNWLLQVEEKQGYGTGQKS